MSGFVAPLSPRTTRGRHVLLDTEDRYDAWNTGRDAPEDYRDGMGLLIVYDGGGTVPNVTMNGPDGQIEFTGEAEIKAVYSAMRCAARYAEAFGPPIPLALWRQLNG
jgi:hypothetical protein